MLYEYDRNQSAYLTTFLPPKPRDEVCRLVPGVEAPKEFDVGPILLAWLSLFMSVLAVSCVGTFIQKMAGVNGLLKSVWFGEGMIVIFSISATIQALVHRAAHKASDYPFVDFSYLFSASGLAVLLFASVGSGIGSGCWTLSLTYTSVAQSYLFNSLHPQLILLARISQFLPVFWEEIVGITVALGGCGLSFYGSQAGTPEGSRVLLGDFLAFISSISQALGLITSKFLLPHLPPVVYLLLVTIGSNLVQLIAAVMVFKGELSMFGPMDGVFGFLDPAFFPWWLAAITCFSIAQYGQMLALRVLNPIVVSIVLTLQPLLATAIQVLVLRAGQWPPGVSLFGNFVLLLGSFLVCWASRYHTVAEEASEDSEDEEEAAAMRPHIRQ